MQNYTKILENLQWPEKRLTAEVLKSLRIAKQNDICLNFDTLKNEVDIYSWRPGLQRCEVKCLKLNVALCP